MLRLCLLSLILASCVSYTEETRKLHSHFLDERYNDALIALEKSSVAKSERNALLYQLEKAILLEKMGRLEDSRNAFFAADHLVDERFTESVSDKALSLIYNDSSIAYGGEDYEKVAIHTLLALSFLKEGDSSSARVEAKKINSRLYDITRQHGDKHNDYREDAMARYLAGMIYEQLSEIDSAIIDYRKALKLFSGSRYQKYYKGIVPKELVQALYRLASFRGRLDVTKPLLKHYPQFFKDKKSFMKKKLASLVCIHRGGFISRKTAEEFMIPFGRQFVRISFPTVQTRQYESFGFSGLVLSSSEGGVFRKEARNVADMNALAYHSLKDRRGRLILKAGARILAKGQLTDRAWRQFGPIGGLAANVYTAITEKADTRSWTLLPASFSVSRVFLKPGKYQVKIFNENRLSSIQDVQLKANDVKFFQAG